MATWSSTNSMLFAVHARPSPSSSALIGRDASLMSVSPTQNFLKPPPVPGQRDRHLDAGVGDLEVLGDGLGDRIDGARTVDGDGSGQGRALRAGAALPGAGRSPALGAVEAPLAAARADGEGRHQGERSEALGGRDRHAMFLLQGPPRRAASRTVPPV